MHRQLIHNANCVNSPFISYRAREKRPIIFRILSRTTTEEGELYDLTERANWSVDKRGILRFFLESMHLTFRGRYCSGC